MPEVRIAKVDREIDRKILIGMITNKHFLAHVSAVMKDIEFPDTWSSTISKWCTNFFARYEAAPREEIETLFHTWEKEAESADVVLVGELLEGLSEQYKATGESLNVEYLLDLAEKRFNQIRLKNLVGSLESSMIQGDLSKAEGFVNNYHRVELSASSGADPFNDPQVWKDAFVQEENPDMIVFQGALGDFFQGQFVRDSFVALQGPEKRGKSFWLMELAYQALRQKKTVAVFEVGDMSQQQWMKRFGARITRSPYRQQDCGKTKIPKKVYKDEDSGDVELDYMEKEFSNAIGWKESYLECMKFYERLGYPKGKPVFKISVHPNSSINIAGVSAILSTWERQDGFCPDVVVVDYADILSPEPDAPKEFRQQVNQTWKSLRRLSQKRHCLVVTATQADIKAASSHVQTMDNFSEDKRKFGHVTGAVGLNQTPEEKQKGIMRLNWLVRREGFYDTRSCVFVGQHLQTARAATCSCW